SSFLLALTLLYAEGRNVPQTGGVGSRSFDAEGRYSDHNRQTILARLCHPGAIRAVRRSSDLGRTRTSKPPALYTRPGTTSGRPAPTALSASRTTLSMEVQAMPGSLIWAVISVRT